MGLEKELGFFNALSADMTPEEIMLESLQTMTAAEISMRRQLLGLSQNQLAEKLHVSQALVSRWETGEVNFKLSTLVKIASALDLKMQLPIVPSPSIHYEKDTTVIIAMPQSNRWESNVYLANNPSAYSAEAAGKLKEN